MSELHPAADLHPALLMIRSKLPNPQLPFVLLVVNTLRPGTLADFAPARDVAARESRKEPGCLQYDFSHDPANPDRLVLYERWKNFDALVNHFSLPHTKAVLEAGDRLAAMPTTLDVLIPLEPVFK